MPGRPAPAADTPQPCGSRCRARSPILTDHDGLGNAEWQALRKGREVRRGQGYSLHLTALPDVHHALLTAAATLGTKGVPRSASIPDLRGAAEQRDAVMDPGTNRCPDAPHRSSLAIERF